MNKQVGLKVGYKNLRHTLGNIYLIDSSTISLCFSQYRWAVFRKTKSGIKLHLRVKLLDYGVIPDKPIATPVKPADKNQIDELVIEEDANALHVFDRAYVDYEKFDLYCKNGIRFTTRLKANALVKVIKELPIPKGSSIKKDQIVILGKNKTTRMTNPLRLIEIEDLEGKPIKIITNDFQPEAQEISDIYRYRWQIELFFKWIKQHLAVKHFYGFSPQAVENQLLIALITYSLILLVKIRTGYQGSLLSIKRLLVICLYQLFSSFLEKLLQKPPRTSRGSLRIDYETIYQEIERQVILGESSHLNDLTYDPLFL